VQWGMTEYMAGRYVESAGDEGNRWGERDGDICITHNAHEAYPA